MDVFGFLYIDWLMFVFDVDVREVGCLEIVFFEVCLIWSIG